MAIQPTYIYKTFDVALELKQTSTNPTFSVIEGDTGNRLHITVTDGGSAVDLTGCRVIAAFSKSNGISMQDSGVADNGITFGGTNNNEVTVDLFASSLAPGNVECELQIYSGLMEVLITTARFNFVCRRGIMNEDVLLSTNEYPLLVDLISTVEGFVGAEQERVDAEQERAAEMAKWASAEAVANTLAAGSSATATLSEVGGVKRFTFGIPKGVDGSGTGDMSKSTYDTNGNGIVDNAEKLGGKLPEEYQEAGNYASPAILRTATLGVASWTGAEAPFSQTVTVNGVVSDVNAQAIIVSPAAGFGTVYGAAGVECISQGTNSLIFTCLVAPENDITVSVAILG